MSSRIHSLTIGGLVLGLLLSAPLLAQGPGSCGIHLDIIANETSTHSAVADAVYPPGGGGFPYPPGAPGNPYQAYAATGSLFTLRLTVPSSTLGPGAFGPGSVITILWSIGTAPIPLLPTPPGILPPCQPGEPLVVTVVPFGGAVVDGIYMILPTPPSPPTPPADPGHPYEFEVVMTMPFLPFAAPINFQAVLVTPTGLIGISNGVGLLGGSNPNEMSLLPGMLPAGGFGFPPDDGYAPIPTPPGFFFYGVFQPMANVHTNPFIEFAPFTGPITVDLDGTPGDLGCPPPTGSASPRITVNHYDADFSAPPPGARVGDVTLEVAPPFSPLMPTRHIIRWKNGVPFASPPPAPDTDYASSVVELWGDDSPVNPHPIPQTNLLVNGHSRIVVVRQDIHYLTGVGATHVHHMVGIGPGPGAVGPCTPLPFWTLFGLPPFVTVPGEAVYMDPATFGAFYPVDSTMQTNLALVLDPLMFGFPPGVYAVQDY